jgi:hypothetical protein
MSLGIGSASLYLIWSQPLFGIVMGAVALVLGIAGLAVAPSRWGFGTALAFSGFAVSVVSLLGFLVWNLLIGGASERPGGIVAEAKPGQLAPAQTSAAEKPPDKQGAKQDPGAAPPDGKSNEQVKEGAKFAEREPAHKAEPDKAKPDSTKPADKAGGGQNPGKPIPKQIEHAWFQNAAIVNAWQKAGAKVGWIYLSPNPKRLFIFFPEFSSPESFHKLPMTRPRRGEQPPFIVPAFSFSPWRPGVIKALPAPGQPFGLDLSGSDVTGVGLLELGHLKEIWVLDLSGTRVTDAGLKELVGLEQLRGLDLGSTRITDTGLKEIANMKQLEWLGLSDTHVTDEGLKHLRVLKGLRWLKLDRTRVTGAGLKELAGLSLEELWIPNQAKTGIGLRHYLAAIKPPAKLDLSCLGSYLGWQITDLDLELLAGLNGLEELNLSGTKITDAGLKHLAGLKRLRKLIIRGTRVTDAGAIELQRQLPECVIER